MNQKITVDQVALDLPEGWTLGNMMFHLNEDLTRDTAPFAGNVVVQPRFDIDAGDDLGLVSERDLRSLEVSLPNLELVGRGEVAVGGLSLEHLEIRFEDMPGRQLQQLVVYVPGDRPLAVIGTHVAGRFDAVRAQIVAIAARFAAAKPVSKKD
jgi:hypothetical protein